MLTAAGRMQARALLPDAIDLARNFHKITKERSSRIVVLFEARAVFGAVGGILGALEGRSLHLPSGGHPGADLNKSLLTDVYICRVHVEYAVEAQDLPDRFVEIFLRRCSAAQLHDALSRGTNLQLGAIDEVLDVVF